MTKPLGIIELLTRVGEDKVQIQNINGTIRGGTAIKRGGIELRVGTGIVTLAELAAGVEDVLWLVRLPRADVDRAIREHALGPADTGEHLAPNGKPIDGYPRQAE